ncbi:hypothetical protein NC651_021386 [Populus alba x Populus x berolinensis]|nr:hypothetical protein NC651_021386 [Populus alba x Populus x berolinensis]
MFLMWYKSSKELLSSLTLKSLMTTHPIHGIYKDSERRFQHVLEACGVNKPIWSQGSFICDFPQWADHGCGLFHPTDGMQTDFLSISCDFSSVTKLLVDFQALDGLSTPCQLDQIVWESDNY